MQVNAVTISVNSIDFKRATKDDLSEIKTRKADHYKKKFVEKKIDFLFVRKKKNNQYQQMKDENTRSTARNYDKMKFMTFKRSLNSTDKLQHHL